MSKDNVLWTLNGSQFASKVVTALDAFRIPYRMVVCDIRKLKEVLPPPHTIPQMEWQGQLLTDSADILKKIDEESRSEWKLYPSDKRAAVEATEAWVGGELNAFVTYFSWWDEQGFQASMYPQIRKTVFPGWIPAVIADFLVPYAFDVGRTRGSIRKKCRGILGETLIPQGRDPGPDEGPGMKRALVSHMATLEKKLSTGKQWIEGTEEPSAADFTLYGILERFVGTSGDAEMGAATPWLWEVRRLWTQNLTPET